MTTQIEPRRRLTDKQALAVIAAYFGSRQITTRAGLAFLPALSASAPFVLPLLRNSLITLIAAGTAARGEPFVLLAIGAASLVMTMVAGSMLYWVGSRFGPWLAERGAQPGSMWSGVWNPKRVERAHRWLDRWGVPAVTLSRLVGSLTGPVALVAGSSRMSRWKFAIAQGIGGTGWAAIVIWLGVRAGDAWPWIPDRLESLSGLSLRVGLISLVLLIVVVSLQAGRRQKTDAPPASERES